MIAPWLHSTEAPVTACCMLTQANSWTCNSGPSKHVTKAFGPAMQLPKQLISRTCNSGLAILLHGMLADQMRHTATTWFCEECADQVQHTATAMRELLPKCNTLQTHGSARSDGRSKATHSNHTVLREVLANQMQHTATTWFGENALIDATHCLAHSLRRHTLHAV